VQGCSRRIYEHDRPRAIVETDTYGVKEVSSTLKVSVTTHDHELGDRGSQLGAPPVPVSKHDKTEARMPHSGCGEDESRDNRAIREAAS
jgi:hypothetical protein